MKKTKSKLKTLTAVIGHLNKTRAGALAIGNDGSRSLQKREVVRSIRRVGKLLHQSYWGVKRIDDFTNICFPNIEYISPYEDIPIDLEKRYKECEKLARKVEAKGCEAEAFGPVARFIHTTENSLNFIIRELEGSRRALRQLI